MIYFSQLLFKDRKLHNFVQTLHNSTIPLIFEHHWLHVNGLMLIRFIDWTVNLQAYRRFTYLIFAFKISFFCISLTKMHSKDSFSFMTKLLRPFSFCLCAIRRIPLVFFPMYIFSYSSLYILKSLNKGKGLLI